MKGDAAGFQNFAAFLMLMGVAGVKKDTESNHNLHPGPGRRGSDYFYHAPDCAGGSGDDNDG